MCISLILSALTALTDSEYRLKVKQHYLRFIATRCHDK